LRSIRDVIVKFDENANIPKSASAELLIRAALNTVWKSQKEDWDSVLQVLERELSSKV